VTVIPLADAIGWAGAACLLLAYARLSSGRLAMGVRYHLLNLVGAGGLAASRSRQPQRERPAERLDRVWPDAVLPEASSRSRRIAPGRPFTSRGCPLSSIGEHREDRGEHAGHVVGTDHAPGKRRRLASPIPDHLDVGSEQLPLSLDVAFPERIEEPRRQLLAFPAVCLELRAPDINVASRAASWRHAASEHPRARRRSQASSARRAGRLEK
jgi:hypothetical protein